MVDLTIFEVHLDGAQFTANAPGSGRSGASDDSSRTLSFGGDGADEYDETEAADGGGSGPLGVVLAFVALIALTVVVRRVLGGSGEPVVE